MAKKKTLPLQPQPYQPQPPQPAQNQHSPQQAQGFDFSENLYKDAPEDDELENDPEDDPTEVPTPAVAIPEEPALTVETQSAAASAVVAPEEDESPEPGPQIEPIQQSPEEWLSELYLYLVRILSDRLSQDPISDATASVALLTADLGMNRVVLLKHGIVKGDTIERLEGQIQKLAAAMEEVAKRQKPATTTRLAEIDPGFAPGPKDGAVPFRDPRHLRPQPK